MEKNSLPELKHAAVTGPLIELFFHVYRILGYGFLEGVYGRAMLISGPRFGIDVAWQEPIQVHYEGHVVGKYFADLVVGKVVLVELKACESLAPRHEAQLLNYLKATTYEVGFLLNFGPKPQYKRMVFDNSRKGGMAWLK